MLNKIVISKNYGIIFKNRYRITLLSFFLNNAKSIRYIIDMKKLDTLALSIAIC